MSTMSCLFGVNLLPSARVAAIRRRGCIKAWSVGCGVYTLGLAVWCVVLSAGSGWGSLKAELETAHAAVQERSREVAASRAELESARRAWEAAQAVGVHPDWSVLLGLLANTRGDEVVLSNCELQPASAAEKVPAAGPARVGGPVAAPGYTLEVHGVALSQRAVSSYVLVLESLDVFETVTLLEAKRAAAAGALRPGMDVVSFKLRCSLVDGRPRKGRGT